MVLCKAPGRLYLILLPLSIIATGMATAALRSSTQARGRGLVTNYHYRTDTKPGVQGGRCSSRNREVQIISANRG